MYKKFFNFKERPFKLTPDPAYLFLSKSHEEALAHLSYAVSHGDGFVEIIGEVGTGKTTLCRVFLETLNENTELAYIFNPKLDAVQLLQAINEEFGIRSDSDTIKELIDTLNSFLMAKKAEDKNVILLIDETQNLKKEVLEQLRLLSNLETTKDKLLQIILVGQPELGEMLDSYELRQLSQRITLSCYLSPLTYKETGEYIQHRINVASQKPGIKFAPAALRAIYRYSKGIPRLINIACDRALLTAYGLNRGKITGDIARAAIRELACRGDIKRLPFLDSKKAILMLSLVCIALVVIILDRGGFFNINHRSKTRGSDKSRIFHSEHAESPMQTVEAFDRTPNNELDTAAVKTKSLLRAAEFEGFLKGTNTRSSRLMAIKAIFELWDTGGKIQDYLQEMDNDQAFFWYAAKQNGLLIHHIQGDLTLLKKLNMPAIMEFYPPGGQTPRYLTLNRIDGPKVVLEGPSKRDEIVLEAGVLNFYWSGAAYIPWKNFLAYRGTIPIDSTKESIITLKMHLLDIGFDGIEISPSYDGKTRQAVKMIQTKYGIPVDGLVGPLTKIALYNEKKSLNIPHIVKD